MCREWCLTEYNRAIEAGGKILDLIIGGITINTTFIVFFLNFLISGYKFQEYFLIILRDIFSVIREIKHTKIKLVLIV